MKQMEKIEKAEGFTSSEKYLINLCTKSFLSLWSYPNLSTDQNTEKNKPSKELCDLLVVFDNNIIIFSDKDILFKEEGDIQINWNRWYKKAIKKSADQLYGADSWIKKFPDRIFLDAKCTKQFPLHVSSNMNTYRIAITKNTNLKAKEAFGDSSPSFIFVNEVYEQSTFKLPFHIGLIDEDKGFVHIFDEYSLDIIFQELDTITDFLSYLRAKEELILTKKLISYTGEEELLESYLSDYSIRDQKWHTLSGYKDGSILLAEGGWQQYKASAYYFELKKSKEISYFWDEVIEEFNHTILSGIVVHGDTNVLSHEKAVRILATEHREARIALSEAYLQKYEQVDVDRRTSRIVSSPSNKKLCYLFLFLPRSPTQDDATYRQERLIYCHNYAYALKVLYPQYKYIAVLATESNKNGFHSYDLLTLDVPKLTTNEINMTKKMMKRDKILYDTKRVEQGEVYTKQAKIGRNFLCPCGSTLKYKRCCGK